MTCSAGKSRAELLSYDHELPAPAPSPPPRLESPDVDYPSGQHSAEVRSFSPPYMHCLQPTLIVWSLDGSQSILTYPDGSRLWSDVMHHLIPGPRPLCNVQGVRAADECNHGRDWPDPGQERRGRDALHDGGRSVAGTSRGPALARPFTQAAAGSKRRRGGRSKGIKPSPRTVDACDHGAANADRESSLVLRAAVETLIVILDASPSVETLLC